MTELFRVYLEISFLLAVGYGVVRLGFALRPLLVRRWLKLAQFSLLLAFALPLAFEGMPRQALPRPSVQVWSGGTRGTAAPYALFAPTVSQSEARPAGWAIQWRHLSAGAWLISLACAFALLVHGWRLWKLRSVLAAATRIRKVGRVEILISQGQQTPFAAWLPGRACVVLPLSLLEARADFAMALGHELQHHRQGDTRWVHAFELCRTLFFWNPAAHGWFRLTERLQELACDEALIGHRGFSPQDYGRCLFRAAQQALGGSPALLAGTTGMAASRSSRFLKRRIEMLFFTKRDSGSKWFVPFFVAGTLVLMSGAALAARTAVQGRGLTLEEVRTLVARDPGGQIPITVNERVLERLNRSIGTPEGREYVREGLERMPLYRAMIETKLGAAGFPLELLAMPMQESGFRNDRIPVSVERSRGIWQFIRPTALNYGLRVDWKVDERLDPIKETDAAVRYLRDLHVLFGDWRLAIKAYNEGERRVQALIEKHHTRDPWELDALASAENYLPGVMAMMIILKNPSLLE